MKHGSLRFPGVRAPKREKAESCQEMPGDAELCASEPRPWERFCHQRLNSISFDGPPLFASGRGLGCCKGLGEQPKDEGTESLTDFEASRALRFSFAVINIWGD